jgi:hypothetical protein
MPTLSVFDSKGEHLYYGMKLDVNSKVYIGFLYVGLVAETERPLSFHYSSPSLMV